MENKKLSYLDILYYAKWEIESRIATEREIIENFYDDECSTYDLDVYKEELIEIEDIIKVEYLKVIEELNKNKE